MSQEPVSPCCVKMLGILSISTFLLLHKIRILNASSCVESYSTISYVKSCPKSEAEWAQRENAFNCGKREHKCESFVYHCTLNEFANATLEVCASSVFILGQRCMEYNIGGKIIQDAHERNCKSCPFSYPSTDAHKYQECYAVSKEDATTTSTYAAEEVTQNMTISVQSDLCECRNIPWDIIGGVSIFLNVVLIVLVTCITIYIYRRRQTWRKKSSEDEDAAQQLLEQFPVKGTPETKDSAELGKSTTEENDADQSSKEDRTSESAKQETKRENKFWVSSIDIGDKYCGMAYLNPEKPENIVAVGEVEKISVLMSTDGEMKYFGKLARKMYISGNPTLQKCILIDELKMTQKEMTVENHKFQTIKIYQKIVIHLLGRIRAEIDKVKPKESEEKTELDIHYVFTVPIHWKNHMKNLRDAILKAEIAPHEKIKQEKLHMKFRRVAISPFIHEVKATVLCLNFNVDNLSFKQNTTYALLHVGSTYCNLLFAQVEDFKKPDTILYKAYRKEWEISPEERFLRIFEDVFTPTAVEEWKKKCRRDYISLLYDFEKQKARMYGNNADNDSDNQRFEFKISTKLCEIRKEKFDASNKEIEDEVNKTYGMDLKISESECIFNISWSLLRGCYKEVKDKTYNVIQENKKVFNKERVCCVFMTGRHSQMKIIQNEAENVWFTEPPVTIAIPMNVGSTFAMGAAYYMNRFPDWPKLEDSCGV